MVPSWIPTEAWNGYCEMRKQKKKPLTAGALVRAVNTLERLMQEGEDLVLVLNQSEDRGWPGLFEVSASYRKERGLSGKNVTQELINKLTDRSWAE
jgi:hypothetical protein